MARLTQVLATEYPFVILEEDRTLASNLLLEKHLAILIGLLLCKDFHPIERCW